MNHFSLGKKAHFAFGLIAAAGMWVIAVSGGRAEVSLFAPTNLTEQHGLMPARARRDGGIRCCDNAEASYKMDDLKTSAVGCEHPVGCLFLRALYGAHRDHRAESVIHGLRTLRSARGRSVGWINILSVPASAHTRRCEAVLHRRPTRGRDMKNHARYTLPRQAIRIYAGTCECADCQHNALVRSIAYQLFRSVRLCRSRWVRGWFADSCLLDSLGVGQTFDRRRVFDFTSGDRRHRDLNSNRIANL